MMKMFTIAVAAATSLILVAPAQSQDAKRSITKVAGDVYRFQNNFHHALVAVTDAGVVVVDPINKAAAQWLRANLKQITDNPITHLIYSHSHGDHASGGKALLSSGTQVIAHSNAPAEIDGVKPTMRFSDTKSLKVGGKTIELTWLGEGHAKDLIAVVVRPENVAFRTDAASPKRLPYRDMPRSNVDGWIDQVRKIETLNFEIFAPAHGSIGKKSDVADVRNYMVKMRERVLSGLKAGKSTDDLAQSVTMSEYKDWQQYKAWRELNVRGMARFLTESGQIK
jgi:glyoxylase-like metal-dependent hydrolase (beta-lactamase superfamily II)